MPQFSDDLFLGPAQTYMGTTTNINTYGTVGAVNIVAGGASYNVGDYVRINGGGGYPCIVQVATVTTGAVTSVTFYDTGRYIGDFPFGTCNSTALTGTGSGFTASLTFNPTMNPDPAPMSLGIGPVGRVYVYDIVPQTIVANNIAASQTPASAGSLVLTAGTSTQSFINTYGQTVVRLDVPRAVTITGTASTTAANYTISGYDVYGQPMTQFIAGPVGATTVTTTKAFKDILSISVSAGTTGAITVGTSDVFGIPVCVIDGGYIADIGWAGSIANDTGTFTAAIVTPSSSSTGDVRGTYKPSTASNGTNRLIIPVYLTGVQVGPYADRQHALGVTQS